MSRVERDIGEAMKTPGPRAPRAVIWEAPGALFRVRARTDRLTGRPASRRPAGGHGGNGPEFRPPHPPALVHLFPQERRYVEVVLQVGEVRPVAPFVGVDRRGSLPAPQQRRVGL